MSISMFTVEWSEKRPRIDTENRVPAPQDGINRSAGMTENQVKLTGSKFNDRAETTITNDSDEEKKPTPHTGEE